MRKQKSGVRNLFGRIIALVALAGIFFVFSFFQTAQSAVGKYVNYQGKLTNNSDVAVADGAYNFVFKIYSVAGGGAASWTESWTDAALWTETDATTITDGDGGDCPTTTKKIAYTTGTNESSLAAGQQLWNTTIKQNSVIESVSTGSNFICVFSPASTWSDGDDLTNRIYVKNGIFSVSLGTISALTENFTSANNFLGVTVGADSEMKPRKRMTAVPQAINSLNVIGDGYIDIDNTSTVQDAANINYNPASGTHDALSITYGSGGGTGTALNIAQAGSGFVFRVNDDGTLTDSTPFVIDAGGNVGIGTTAPGQKLEVAGSGYFTTGTYIGANSTNNLIDDASNGAGSTTLYIGNKAIATTGSGGSISGTQNKIAKFTSTTAVGDSQLWDDGTNVGIGTSAPAGLFDVNGKLTVLSGGNVGIGTTNPLARLHVSGGTGTLDTGLAFGDGDSGIYEITDDQLAFQVSGVSPIYYAGTYLRGAVNENFEIATLQTTSSTVPIYSFRNDTDTGINRAADNILSLIAGGTNVLNVTAGNVGIGTTAPGYLFDTRGSVASYIGYFYNSSTSASAGGLYIRSDGTGSLLTLNYNGSNIVDITQAQSTFNNPANFAAQGDVSMAYDLYMTNTTAGYLKFNGPGYIQTESAYDSLDLTLSAANSGFVVIDDTLQENLTSTSITGASEYGYQGTISDTGVVSSGTDNTYGSYLSLTRTGATGGTINSYGQYITLTADNAGAGTSSAYGLYVDTSNSTADKTVSAYFSGNVGIGTTSPGAQLDIINLNGQASLRLGAYGTYYSMTLDANTISANNNALVLQPTAGNVGIGSTNPATLLSIGASNLVNVTSGGNVGIGTTAPGNKLAVSGGVGIGTTAVGSLYLSTAAPDGGMIIEGNVGIGTTNPISLLNVEKSAYASNLVVINNGTTGAPNTYPSSFTPTLVVNAGETSGSRPLWFGYKNGANWDAFLTSGACGSFSYMCLDMGSGASVYTALENVSTTLYVGGGDDGSFTNVLFKNSGNVGIGTTNPTQLLSVGAGNQFQVDSSGNATAAKYNNLTLTSNADGFAVAGGTASRTLTVTGSNITLTGGGNTLTMTGSASLNQSVLTSSAPQFAGLTLTGAMTINDDQLLQIGTSADGVILNRSTSLTANTALAGVFVGTPVVPAIVANTTIFSNITTDADMIFAVNDGGNSKELLRLTGATPSVDIGTGTTSMSIDSGGNVGIGTTAPARALDVTGIIRYTTEDSDASNNYVCYNTTNKTLSNCTSLREYKENVIALGLGLETVMKLNPVRYTVKQSGETTLGFIAEDVELVDPLLASYKDGKLDGVRMPQMSALLVKAIQQQQGTINDQGSAISNLDLKINDSKSDVSGLQTAVNEKLTLISSSLTALDTRNSANETEISTLKSQLSTAETKLAEAENNLATFETATNDTISTMLETENMLTQRVLNHEDRIKALEEKIATISVSGGGEISSNVLTPDENGNVKLAGIFQSKEIKTENVETKTATVTNLDAQQSNTDESVSGLYSVKTGDIEASSLGEAEIAKVSRSENGSVVADGTGSDGKSVFVETKAVSENSQVFVTSKTILDQPLIVTEIKPGEGFKVAIKNPSEENIKFSWWVVDKR